MSLKVKIYSDGGARGNPGPAAIGVLICNEKGEMLREHNETIGDTTNNVAEYTAVIVGLELAKTLGAVEVDYYADSELVVKQLSGLYKVKTPHILTLFTKVKAAEKNFSKVRFTHVPRTHEKLRYVDKLVNQALDEAGH
jgi:ribonuclease HI